MASQIHTVSSVRSFLSRAVRVLFSLIIALGMLGTSIPRVQAAGSETISGTVTDSAGTPIEGVQVYANTYDSDQPADSAVTDKGGDYILSVDPGTYRVRACPGCSDPMLPYANQYANGTSVWNDAQEVDTTGGPVTGLNFTLEPGGSISGQVLDSDSNPIASLTLAVLNDDQQWVDAGVTDPAGNYVINGVPYGSFKVLACASCFNGTATYINSYYNGSLTFEAASPVTVDAVTNPSDINFSLEVGSAIEGIVTDISDAPLEDIQVAAVQWDTASSQWQWVRDVRTGADGKYTISGLLDGSYRVQACPECSGKYYVGEYYNNKTNIDESDEVNLAVGETVSNIDFSLDAAAIISGHVTGPGGSALQNIPILADNTDETNYSGWTDADGNYTITVKPGSYKVHTQLEWNSELSSVNLLNQYYNHAASADTAEVLTLESQTTTSNIDFSLLEGNTIQGVVTDNAATPNPLQGIKVAALQLDTESNQWNWIKDVETVSNGSYILTGLPDGEYRIQACPECSGKSYVGLYFDNTTNFDEAHNFTLENGQSVSDINFALNAAGIISGRVTGGADGTTPLANIPVYAENSQGGNSPSAWTDTDGNYSLYVEPGYYRLRTFVEWNSELDAMSYVNQIYDHALNMEEAPVIEAVVGETYSGYDFSLVQGGRLTGTIEDDQSQPLENAYVMAVAADGSRRSYGSQPTGADGVYNLRGLPAGSYIIRATHEGSQPIYYGGNTDWSSAAPVNIASGETTANFTLPAETGEDPDLLTMRQSATIMDGYDPGWTEYVDQAYVVDQIFSGVTRIDPQNGSTLPDLSNTWESTDNIHWTFTLQDGLKWSDGSPLTAADLRFALLRNIKMDTQNKHTYNLDLIEGVENYNQGKAGADTVGITLSASDPTHTIEFTLTQPAAFFPTLMSTMATRPLPQILVQAFPYEWTALDKVVTSGPYRLVEFDQNHILMKKNMSFINQGSVQIQQVVIQSLSPDEAWNKYLSGELDTATIPGANMNAANTDPIVKAQLQLVPQQCTTYAAFNTNLLPAGSELAPDKAVLLRKALIEAIDRDAFTASIGGGVTTAWTFIAPGVLGHSDESADIHLSYDTTQALADIQAAYGGHYTGLPAISLYYPNNVQTTAVQRVQMEFLANAWNQTLNTHFTVVGLPLNEYEDKIVNSQMFAYRRGWCSDYNDGYNFLAFLSNYPNLFGEWQNSTFDNLLSQAAGTSNETDRAAVYQQAEEIVLKTDAIMMPLYYNVNPILSRGFVRSFGVGGSDYIADWTLDRTDEKEMGAWADSLSAQADTVTFEPAGEGGAVVYSVPESAFPARTTLVHTGHLTYNLFNLPAGKAKTSLYFTLQAEDTDHAPVAAAADYTLTVHYAQAEVEASHLMENTLALYYWDGSKWVLDGNSRLDPAANTITTHSRHLGEWLVMGTEWKAKVFIPFVVR